MRNRAEVAIDRDVGRRGGFGHETKLNNNSAEPDLTVYRSKYMTISHCL